MDYIQEIATGYIRWRASVDVPPKVEATIEHAIDNEFHEAGLTLWKWQDERTIQLLTSVLYTHPTLILSIVNEAAAFMKVHALAESPVSIPVFLEDIVTKTKALLTNTKWYLRWNSNLEESKDVGEYTGTAQEIVLQLLSRYVYPDDPQFETVLQKELEKGTFNEKLRGNLLEKPAFVYAMAGTLECAVPFTIVLDDELDEILESRKIRLQPDEDAQAALMLKDLQECQSLLEKLRPASATRLEVRPSRLGGKSESGSRPASQTQTDDLDSEVKRLLKRKESLKEALADLMSEKQAKGKTAGTPHSADSTTQHGRRAPGERPPEVGAPPTSGSKTTDGAKDFPPRRASKENLIGLAFSGGGIRSATFNLGVLQALADLDLLRQVDYLSAVSGGSYIAAWLTAWCKRQNDGIRRVQRWLSPWRSPDPTTEEVKPIWFLREYSNYLTPKKGLFSADTWSLVAIWTRNTLLNQIILLLFLAGILLIPRPLTHYADAVGTNAPAALLACTLILIVSILIGSNLAKFERSSAGVLVESWLPRGLAGQGGIQATIVAILVLVSYWGSALLLHQVQSVCSQDANLGTFVYSWSTLIVGLGIFICLMLAQVFGRFHRCFYVYRLADTTSKRKILAYVALLAVNLAAGFVGGVLVSVATWCFAKVPQAIRQIHVLTWGPALLIAVFSSVMILQIGLQGINFPDERREWWSRLGAWLYIYSLGWFFVFAFAFYGPWLILRETSAWRAAGGIAWAATTVWGVLAGRSSKTSFAAGHQQINLLSWGAKVAPYVFVVGLLLLISFGVHSVIASSGVGGPLNGKPFSSSLPELVPYYTDAFPLFASLIAFVLAFFFAWRVDINEFSMHHLYRNRLMRCYLGATRPEKERKANPFTGFDRTDDVQLSQMHTRAKSPTKTPDPYFGPYLIVNTALNLVGGKELAWQERKAESFFFGPRYCGYESVNLGHRSNDRKWAAAAYRPTRSYAYRNGGVGLATAVAISGAAANSSMGYHSSPALSFLMTLFNVRLGWWIGNPRHERKWRRYSPRVGLLYLLSELTGGTKDTSGYVNLSDGGHFENLGVYELVRRKCRYIIACDSEEDHSFTFGGLGNLVRKCRTDFGVDIKLRLDQVRPLDSASGSKSHCVVGDIYYPGPEPMTGLLLYMKSSLTRDENVDVLEYGWREKPFPHQTTADQWFDESQFESYRALGFHVAYTAFKNADLRKDLDSVFSELCEIWYPPSTSLEKSFTKHAEAYQKLIERARRDNLVFMDSMLLPDFNRVATMGAQKELKEEERRSASYFCNSLIQLMENVYLDLNLEHESDQPHNQGWIQLFRYWCASELMETAWKAAGKTYGTRFQVFCQRKLFPK